MQCPRRRAPRCASASRWSAWPPRPWLSTTASPSVRYELRSLRQCRRVCGMNCAPFVSVVIPMRNESGWIQECLDAVLAQDWPRDRIEVIVVDGMSEDGSYETVSALAARDPRIRVLRNPARIVPSSLNLAIESARGDVIARVDAHTLLEPDYIRTGVEVLERTGADNAGGPMVSIGGGKVGDAVATAMASRFGIGAY